MNRFLLPLILLASLGAGCAPVDQIKQAMEPTPSKSSETSSTGMVRDDDESTSLKDEIAAKMKVSVSMWDNGYSPKSLFISQGVTITFKNNDKVSHSVTSDTGNFDLGVLQPRQSATLNTKNMKPGKYGFHDQLHKEYKGTITIH